MKRSFQLSALAVLVASLSACGGSSNSSPVAQDVALGDQRQWVGVQGVLPASDPDGDDLTITFLENGSAVSRNSDGYFEFSHGLLDFNASTLAYSYVPLMTGSSASFEYRVSDGDLSDTGTVTIGNVAGDPLAFEQWHLNNTGQTGFAGQEQTFEAWRELRIAQGFTEEQAIAAFSPIPNFLVPGEDLNVIGAYKLGITGEGSISVVVDEGMSTTHEDLVANVLPGRSINFLNVADRTDTTKSGNAGDHGTSVAGLIAAAGWNGLGGRGVAPDSSLIGMNFLASQSQRNEMMSYGMAGSGITASDNLVSFNRSYGRSAPLFFVTDEIDEVMYAFPTENLRDGLGALNIKSSGNSFATAASWPEGNELCTLAQSGIIPPFTRVLGCYDGNWDPANASFYTVSVGALNPNGGRTSYSTTGSNLWISAPAGEFGDTEPAMITTDQTTCTRGYSGFPAYDAFQNANGAFLASLGITDFHERIYPFNNPLGDTNAEFNAACNYTNTFNGTSSAAPNAAGVAALIAQANPDLSWREIRYILAATATQVAPNDGPIVLNVGGGEFVAHQGWVENAAGYSFNNQYGFGRPNAGAAVELAMSGGVSLPDLIVTDWAAAPISEPVAIPDNDANGVSLTITVEDDVIVEGVQFAFDIFSQDLVDVFLEESTGTTAASDIGIEVTSPSGTTSVIATSRTSLGAYIGLGNADFDNGIGFAYLASAPILTNAFLGESAAGDWTVRFVDTNGADLDDFLNNVTDSLVVGAQVRVFGH
ncbi:proprotein convertase P-domain-containing protein [Aliidiomarina maris]|nr:proprotein convertase P-domain-containing protein [Aliidiomarina maris]